MPLLSFPVSIVENPTGYFRCYVSADIEGAKIDLLVDTGASYSILPITVFRTPPPVGRAEKFDMPMFGRKLSCYLRHVEIGLLDVEIAPRKVVVQAVIVDDQGPLDDDFKVNYPPIPILGLSPLLPYGSLLLENRALLVDAELPVWTQETAALIVPGLADPDIYDS